MLRNTDRIRPAGDSARADRVNRAPAHFVFVLLATLAVASGCDIFDGPNPPSQAELTVTSTGELPVRVITSNDFFTEVDQETGETTLTYVTSDTLMVVGQHAQNYAMGANVRFAVNATVPDAEDPQNVSMQVWLDGTEHYNSTGDLVDGEALQFLFIYH
jgi:hypothetical protein